MDREEKYDLEDMEEAEEQREDMMEDDSEMTREMQEAYGYPQPDPKFNQHIFLHKAAFENPDTTRVTFLTKEELGRPLFSVRFMSDLQDISKQIIGKVPFNGKNIIDEYWNEKIQNITGTGMSNEGFSMKLNVSQIRDMTRKRVRDTSGLKNQKGVKQQYGSA